MAQEVKFFNSRREMEIGDFVSLKSKGAERRIKASLHIPMSNRTTQGVPDWLLDGYQFVVKDSSYYDKTSCKGIKLEGMSVDLFTTDTVKRKTRTLNGCTLDKFAVERVGKDDKAETFLRFVCYVPASLEIMQFFYEMQGATVYSEFDTTQASFAYEGESDDEDEGEEGERPAFDFDPEAEAAAEAADADPRTTPKRSNKKKVIN